MSDGGWLLDTNVLSERRKASRGDPAVRAWSRAAPRSACFISLVTIVEIQRGLDAVPDGAFKAELAAWLKLDILVWFGGRILAADEAVLRCWVDVIARARRDGRNSSQPDTLIAATAMVHRCVLVTRNTRDFAGIGSPLLNPWQA